VTKKHKSYFPSLDDIAFEGRNKDYGAYFLRKKYNKYLVISGIIATFIFFILVSVPIFLDVFEKPVSFEMMIPMTEYYSLDPPSDDDLSAVAKALAPEPEVEKIPEIVDSVKPEEQKKPEIIEPEKDAEVTKSDTVSGGGSGDDKAGTGPGEDTGIYTTIDVYPRFPGGDQARFYFLRSNIRYPETALKAGIHGVVMLVFVIEPSGEISNVEVAGGIGGGCDEEAVRVIKLMPRWEPGKRSGRAVRVLVRMPIVFKIPGKK